MEATDIGIFDGSGKLTLHFAADGTTHTVGTMDMALHPRWHPQAHAQGHLDKAAGARSSRHVEAPKDFAAEIHAPPRACPPSPANTGSSANTTTKCRAAPSSSRSSAATHDGPGDASVVAPVLGTAEAAWRSPAGCQPRFGDIDPYQMALNGIDEAIRNIVCVGGDPDAPPSSTTSAGPSAPTRSNLGALVNACQACYDGAMAYGMPFVSGKDSLSNEFITDKGERIQIPYTLLISAMSIVDDVDQVHHDGRQTSGQPAGAGRPDQARTGRLALLRPAAA